MFLWLDGDHDARLNMARDAELLEAVAAGRLAEPVMRLFRFRPAGITLGASQEPARELELERLEADGIEWAVRPTGGRAIYHDQEWTFSLASPLGAAGGWAADASRAYARTCGLLAGALRDLGVPAESAPGSPRGVGAPRGAGAAAPCFASTARHELLLGGRKLAGIAQRRLRGALLQQGSILLGDSHVRLVAYQRLAPAARAAAGEALAAAAGHAGEWLGPDAPLGALAGALAARLTNAVRLDGEAGAVELLGPAGPDAGPPSRRA